jgi:hypothetical protein
MAPKEEFQRNLGSTSPGHGKSDRCLPGVALGLAALLDLLQTRWEFLFRIRLPWSFELGADRPSPILLSIVDTVNVVVARISDDDIYPQIRSKRKLYIIVSFCSVAMGWRMGCE